MLTVMVKCDGSVRFDTLSGGSSNSYKHNSCWASLWNEVTVAVYTYIVSQSTFAVHKVSVCCTCTAHAWHMYARRVARIGVHYQAGHRFLQAVKCLVVT